MRRALILAGQAAVTVVLVWLLLRGVEWTSFIALFGQLPAWFYLLSLAVVTMGQVLYAWRWQALLGAAAARHVPFGRVLEQYLIGLFVNNFVPSTLAGDATKVYYLGRQYGHRLVAASVLLDRLLGIGLLALLGLVGLLASTVATPAMVAARGVLAGVVGLVVLVVVGAMTGTGGLARRVRVLGDRAVTIAEHLQAIRLGVAAAIVSPLAVMRAAIVVLAYFLALAWIVEIYVQLHLGYFVPFAPLLGALSAATVIANVPVSLNGLGLREQVFVALMLPLGVPKEAALAISLLLFANSVLSSLAGGILWWRQPAPAAGRVPFGEASA